MPAFVTAVECWVLRAAIAAPVANAFGSMGNRPGVFVRVSASDGAFGWGEVFCNFPQVGAEHRARLIDSIFAPLLADAATHDADAIRTMLDQRTRAMAIQCGEPGPFAQIIGGIDQALWDMSARRAGEPLWRHLGGRDPRVRVYASGIGPDNVVDVALRKRNEGYRAFKLKVGFNAKSDRSNLAALREALGNEATIMIDANQAWSFDEAVERMRMLAPFRPHWIEEPMLADEPLAVWKVLAQRLDVAIAAGENIRGAAAFREAIDGGHLRFVQPDVGKWGGISGCREVARHAASRGVAFCPHWLAGGVGLAASLHLTAAAGTRTSYAEVDANPNPLRERVFAMPVVDGIVTLSDAPGIGFNPDIAALARLK
ncbi:MAG TPA: mandelate racemase/muconate lactonizing enzyme family protein [Casimicrobiaceae bacterium]|nr:mandelate racemase/muconate lactonizing enzyme family protein [Casimicrobiaceae bacterium]